MQCWHITIFCTATTVAIVILSINLVVFFHKRLPLFENVYERKTVIEEQCTAKTGHCYAVIDHVWTRRFRDQTHAARYLYEQPGERLISTATLKVMPNPETGSWPLETLDSKSDFHGLAMMPPFLFGSFSLPPLKVTNDFLDLGGTAVSMLYRSRLPFLQIQLVNRDHVVAGLHERWFNQPTDNRTRVLEADIIDYIADSRRRGQKSTYILVDACSLDLCRKDVALGDRLIFSDLQNMVKAGGTISISMHNVYKEKGRAAVFQLTKQLEAYFPSCFVFEARIAEEVLTVCTKTDIPPKPILISRLETAIRDVRLNHMRQMKIRKSNQSIYLAWKK